MKFSALIFLLLSMGTPLMSTYSADQDDNNFECSQTDIHKDNAMQKAYAVIAFLEAKPGKESELENELIAVSEASRKESTCLMYRLHQDLNNPAHFVLYENWTSKASHEQQFQKPYIIALVSKLEQLLAKPYQAIVAQEI